MQSIPLGHVAVAVTPSVTVGIPIRAAVTLTVTVVAAVLLPIPLAAPVSLTVPVAAPMPLTVCGHGRFAGGSSSADLPSDTSAGGAALDARRRVLLLRVLLSLKSPLPAVELRLLVVQRIKVRDLRSHAVVR